MLHTVQDRQSGTEGEREEKMQSPTCSLTYSDTMDDCLFGVPVITSPNII